MTNLDLICAPHYFIGMLGSMSFVCFAIGSFTFTKQADIIGRHKVTVIASIMTPICLLVLYFGAQNSGVYLVYPVMACLAVTYNPRSSTVYLYAAEFLPPNKRLWFGSTLFFLDGCFGIFASYYFYTWKDQNLFFIIIGTIFTISLVILAFFLPETPSFLLMKGDVAGFKKSIEMMTGVPAEQTEALTD